MNVYGRPGAYATKLMYTYLKQAGVFVLFVIVFAALAFVGYLSSTTSLLIAGAVVAFISLFPLSQQWKKFKKAKIGVDAEKLVAKKLTKSSLQGTTYLGLLIDAGGDADAIVVVNGVVFVIEIKAGFGAVTSKNNTIFSNGRPMRSQPVSQVCRQSVAAARLTRSTPVAVVCISKGRLKPFRLTSASQPVYVCNADTLVQLLNELSVQSGNATLNGLNAQAKKQGLL